MVLENLIEFINSGKLDSKAISLYRSNGMSRRMCKWWWTTTCNAAKIEIKINIKAVRASVLYNQDKNVVKRKSHENAALLKMYETYMGEPGKGKAHELLHLNIRKKKIIKKNFIINKI